MQVRLFTEAKARCMHKLWELYGSHNFNIMVGTISSSPHITVWRLLKVCNLIQHEYVVTACTVDTNNVM